MIGIVLGSIAILAIALVAIYNGLVTLRQRTRQAYADIDVQLAQRRDLVPNLVEIVKGYAAHEKSALEEAVSARNRTATAKGPEALAAAESALSGALSKIIALSEAYPDLKANQNFLALQSELANLEARISAARRFLNNSVSEYNAALERVPAVFFARSFGFIPQQPFNLEQSDHSSALIPPNLKF